MLFSASGIMIRKWEVKSVPAPEWFKSMLGSMGVDRGYSYPLWTQTPTSHQAPTQVDFSHATFHITGLNESGGVIGVRGLGCSTAPAAQ